MNLQVLTPDSQVFSGEISQVYVPSIEGVIGILPHHTNLFSALTEGVIQIKSGEKTELLSIGGGFVKVENNQVTILVSRAVGADQLDEQAIELAKHEAEEALKHKPSGNELLQYQSILRQSITDLKLLRKRKKSAV